MESCSASYKSISQKPLSKKVKTLTWHKLGTVRKRACALQESFYPTEEVSYAAVKTRMATLLGIVDRISILSYLGRPAHRTRSMMEQTVKYPNATVQKKHTFYKKLSAKRGYIDLFGLGYIYIKENGVWFIHWNHSSVVNEIFRISQLESDRGKGSIDDLYLTNKRRSLGSSEDSKKLVDDGSRETEKRESSLCEREISCLAVTTAKMQTRDTKGMFRKDKNMLVKKRV